MLAIFPWWVASHAYSVLVFVIDCAKAYGCVVRCVGGDEHIHVGSYCRHRWLHLCLVQSIRISLIVPMWSPNCSPGEREHRALKFTSVTLVCKILAVLH